MGCSSSKPLKPRATTTSPPESPTLPLGINQLENQPLDKSWPFKSQIITKINTDAVQPPQIQQQGNTRPESHATTKPKTQTRNPDKASTSNVTVPQVNHFLPLQRPGNFRILNIHPASSRDSPIVFGLTEHALEHPPSYEAISYTWDGQPFDRESTKDGNQFLITANCEDILRNLRHQTSSRFLWIDQICIDQSSNEDKSINVGNMANIYQKSEKVIIWTGACDDQLMSVFPRMIVELVPATDFVSPIERGKGSINLIRLEHGTQEWDLIHGFFDRPWFHRIWTLQEAAMAPQFQTFLLTGEYLISLTQITMGLYSDTLSMRNLMAMVFLGAGLSGDGDADTRLSKLLFQCRTRLCTEPKDRIWALYSMIKMNWPRYNPSVDFTFPAPDYRRGIQHVLTSAARWALVDNLDLKLLYLCPVSGSEGVQLVLQGVNELSGSGDLPSWAPDPSLLSHIHRIDHMDQNALKHVGGSCCRGSKASLASPSFQEPGTLKLKIYFYDTVKKVGGEMLPSISARTKETVVSSVDEMLDLHNTLGAWYMLVLLHAQDQQQFKRLSQALWEAILQYPSDKSAMSPRKAFCTKYAEIYEKYTNHRYQTALLSLFRARGTEKETVTNAFSESIFGLLRDEPTRNDVYSTFCGIEKHCLLITEKLHVATAFGTVQEGDHVVLVGGLKKPIILRKVGNDYRVVGHAYVAGIMEGEAWPEETSRLTEVSLV